MGQSNQNSRNYQKELEQLLAGFDSNNGTPRLLLHACCGPCSSYCIEYLSSFFDIDVVFYNPNIYPEEEFYKREREIDRFIGLFPTNNNVRLIKADYNHDEFLQAVKGLENVPEGGERCFICYRQRLLYTAKLAEAGGYDYFTTTLSISPLKNAKKINEIGEELSTIYKVEHLPSDFKKKNGYKRSTELSAEYEMYRQDFCGCEFSRRKDFIRG